ncbi:branched-chain amino acid ABC transporter permease, partial [Streptomyces nigra]
GVAVTGVGGAVDVRVLTSPTPFIRPISSRAGSIRDRTDASRTGPAAQPVEVGPGVPAVRADQFMAEYQLLLFGIALMLLMRFRPEGLVADRRKQLEFHETGQLDVPEDKPLPEGATGVAKAGA